MARALLISEALENEDRVQTRSVTRLRRQLRTNFTAMELSEEEFKANYRLTKDLYLNLCNELKPFVAPSRRRSRISLECKVLTALSFYATGSYQRSVGMNFLHGLSQASVSNAVKEITTAMNSGHILSKYIHFPQNRQERLSIVKGFSDKFGFPGCMGCIDCTHVALIKPKDHEERFLNRKRYHSRNVQIICDSDMNILNIDASFGGATHDAHIWQNSDAHEHLQELYRRGENSWLLGDSAYPLRPWLLTPIINADAGTPEEHYTNVHCHIRNSVERCIGILKARWRCLLAHRVLHYEHNMVAKIINACAVLHNICNLNRLPEPPMPDLESQRDLNRQLQDLLPPTNSDARQADLTTGRDVRSRIVSRLWSTRQQ